MSKDNDEIDLIEILYGFIIGVLFMLIIGCIKRIIQ